MKRWGVREKKISEKGEQQSPSKLWVVSRCHRMDSAEGGHVFLLSSLDELKRTAGVYFEWCKFGRASQTQVQFENRSWEGASSQVI
jgi:hypothetical protein